MNKIVAKWLAFTKKHRKIAYLARWQASGIILAPSIWVFLTILHSTVTWGTIASNFLGGMLFWYFDKWLLEKGDKVDLPPE